MKILAFSFFAIFVPSVLAAQQFETKDSLVAINVSALNSSGGEMFPFLPYDENNLYFTRANRQDGLQKIWVAARNPDSTWSEPKPIPRMNQFGIIGSMASDSAGEIFFASKGSAKANDLDIYALVDGTISDLDTPVNTTQWESQPYITYNGRDLYFVSNRGPQKRNVNIFVSRRTSDGKWSEPVGLGSKINSGPYNGSPYLTRDGKTLLFASGGGSLGIYISKKIGPTDTDWSEPVLLPYPINDHYNSLSACLSPDEKELYFASNRPGGYGQYDIYMIRLPRGLASLLP